MVMSKHFFFRNRLNLTPLARRPPPSHVALFKRCKQHGSRGFGFVLTSAEKGVETINQGVDLVYR